MGKATLLAGVPAINKTVFRRVGLSAHDPAIVVELDARPAVVIVRDVELPRARASCPHDHVRVYEDFTPQDGLSGDREVRAAQSAAECLVRLGVHAVRTDRSLPVLYADELRRRGIALEVDRDLGVLDRRRKSEREVDSLRAAQRATEDAIEWACRMIARARVLRSGELDDPQAPGEPLTSERVRRRIETRLGERGFVAEHSIVACGPQGADCHERGHGPLRTEAPIIVDVFPRDADTAYHGDCTRVVVHGQVPDEVARMHAAVAHAKRAAIAATHAGASAEAVHRAVIAVVERAGFRTGFAPEGAPHGYCSMPHGTGHGLGLDLKEPPLLDLAGPPLMAGDAVTVEPGLYMVGVGGVRLEDLVIVREGHAENLNTLHEGLDWR